METNVKKESPPQNGQSKNFQQGKSSLESFASEMVAKNHFIKASFEGFAGSGKSRTSSEFVAGVYKQLGCTKPILIIDNEKGSRFLIPFFKKQLPKTKVFLKDTNELADILQAMTLLDSGEIDFLFIDSLSKVWYKYVADYKQKNKIAFMTLQDWGKILPAWQAEFSDRFVNIAGSIVFTGRGGFTYEREEDTKDDSGRVTKKGAFVKSGVKMKMAGETPFEPDINIWMEQEQSISEKGDVSVWREAHIMKDRSGQIDGKTFKNPTYKDFKPIIDFLGALATGEVSGATNTTNLAPSENWEAKDRREQREICLEEIKSVFDVLSFGQSADAKKTKVSILERLFTTPSWTAIEGLPLDVLKSGIENLKAFRALYEKEKPDTFEATMAVLSKCIDDQFVFDKA